MSILGRVLGWVRRDRAARRRGEIDAPAENAGPRPTGGRPPGATQDQHSTTGTTEHDEFVGRAGGDEAGEPGTSGGESRSGGPVSGDTGAGRDDPSSGPRP